MRAAGGARRGLYAGAAAGGVAMAAMYLAAALVGVQPLSQLLQQPLLEVMPGPLFGFLIDNLQHLGKVVEEVGLLLALVAALALGGALYGWIRERRRVPHLGLLFAAGAWLVVVLALLPLGGAGLFGLREGVAAPIVWALLAVVYGVGLDLAYDAAGADAERADEDRRRLLRLLPAAAALAALGVLGAKLVPGWYQAVAHPPEAGLEGPSPELTPVANFYVVSKNFSDPEVDEAGWALSVHGLVDEPLKLDLAALRALPGVTEHVTLECVSNDVGGPLMSTGTFTGVPLRDLVAKAAARAEAGAVVFRARDGYTESLSLATVRSSPEILVAHALDGQPLPPEHGFPARILVPGHYGMKGPKWLDEVELVRSPVNGYWEDQGWDRDAVVKTTARFDTPRDGFILKLGPIPLAGVAFAGVRGVQAVEYSADGGRSWTAAALQPPLSALTWVLWSATWTPAAEGAYTLLVRARDGAGKLQTSSIAPSFPDGASGYHSVRVSVSAAT